MLPASLSVVPEKFSRSPSEYRLGSPLSVSPKALKAGSQMEGRERLTKKLSEGSQVGRRSRAGSLGHRRTPSSGSTGHKSAPLSCLTPPANKGQFAWPGPSAPVPIPRQNTEEDDVFQRDDRLSKANDGRDGGPVEGQRVDQVPDPREPDPEVTTKGKDATSQ